MKRDLQYYLHHENLLCFSTLKKREWKEKIRGKKERKTGTGRIEIGKDFKKERILRVGEEEKRNWGKSETEVDKEIENRKWGIERIESLFYLTFFLCVLKKRDKVREKN